MHFGEPLDDDRFIALIRRAYDKGIRTFLTADVYGAGEADTLLGRALEGTPRDSYCLVGAIGHDFYHGQRDGAKGFPRFTSSALRKPREYASYLRSATEKSLARCRSDRFDLLLLHNPDSAGYTTDAVWKGMAKLKDAGLTGSARDCSGAGEWIYPRFDSLPRAIPGIDRLGHDHPQSTGAVAGPPLPSGRGESRNENHNAGRGLRRPFPRRCETGPPVRTTRSPNVSSRWLGRGGRRKNRKDARDRRRARSHDVAACLHLEPSACRGAKRGSDLDSGTRRWGKTNRGKSGRTRHAPGRDSNPG